VHELSPGLTIPPEIVGLEVGPLFHEIDARWLMAYAAGVGATAPRYLDTGRAGGILSHPLFPVAYEWPAALAIRAKALPEAVGGKAVHATHDLRLHRLPLPGDRLATTARVVAVEPRRPGAYVLTRFETRDARGQPVTTTEAGALYLGVETPGAAAAPRTAEAREVAPRWEAPLAVGPGAAHVYTECARIWNPIHTDRAVARARGLPDLILHGTATLAMAVSALIEAEADGDPARVARVRCRFGAMVLLPSRVTVQGLDRSLSAEGEQVAFRVLTERGEPAIRDGVLTLR
jgi:acyl dehydratase